MSDPKRMMQAIGLIYDAAEDASRWPAALTEVAGLVDASAALLYAYKRDGQFSLTVPIGAPDAAISQYQAYYAALDEKLSRAWLAPVGVVVDERFLLRSQHQFDRTEVWNDFYRGFDAFWCCGGALARSDRLLSGYGLHRARRLGSYTDGELQLVQALVPHLQQALRLQFQLAALRSEKEARDALLDRLPVGFYFAAADATVISTNAAARTLLQARDGVAFERGRLAAARADQTAELHRLIAGASRTTLRRGLEAGGVLRLERPSGAEPLLAAIMPISHTAPTGFFPVATALVLVADPEKRVWLPHEQLRRLYGLTPAEAKVAAGLAAGDSVTAVAERIGVARETVRVHLKHILLKTDTARQGDLVRLLLTGPAVLLGHGDDDGGATSRR